MLLIEELGDLELVVVEFVDLAAVLTSMLQMSECSARKEEEEGQVAFGLTIDFEKDSFAPQIQPLLWL